MRVQPKFPAEVSSLPVEWANENPAKRETVQLADLVTNAAPLNPQQLQQLAGEEIREPVAVVKHKGCMYLVNGAHRAWAKALAGEKTIEAMVQPATAEDLESNSQAIVGGSGAEDMPSREVPSRHRQRGRGNREGSNGGSGPEAQEVRVVPNQMRNED